MMIVNYIYKYAFCIFLGIFFFSCVGKQQHERIVSVSILPQKYFVERIAGDYVQVNVMIPPGMNPATCDLNTEQLKKLYDSDICFAVGYLPFETTHLYPVLQGRDKPLLVRHSDKMELLEGTCDHHHAGEGDIHRVDPHIWLSPRYADSICYEIYQVLSEKYPEKAVNFTANYEQLKADINRIAQRARQMSETKNHKAFLIYHPALTYFAKDYGMEQIAIEDEGKEPAPAHLKEIIDMTKEKDIHIIFIQSQFDINNANSVAAATGIKVIAIDPLSADWLREMENLIGLFNENLE